MAVIGDRVRVESATAPPREGVVIAVVGAMLRVHWASGSESMLVPAPGSLTILRRAKRSGARTKASKPAAAQPEAARPERAGSTRRAAPKPSSVRARASAKPTVANAGAKHASDKVSDKKAATSKPGRNSASARKKR